uniref:Uncharacterized protein n=1 Tax=Anguilla anguilla TaxID=7936 RepID=A0A0E9TM90_ANGAN
MSLKLDCFHGGLIVCVCSCSLNDYLGVGVS